MSYYCLLGAVRVRTGSKLIRTGQLQFATNSSEELTAVARPVPECHLPWAACSDSVVLWCTGATSRGISRFCLSWFLKRILTRLLVAFNEEHYSFRLYLS